MTDDDLRAWAEPTIRFWGDDEGAVPMKVAQGILRLLAEKDAHVERSAALVIENAQLRLQVSAMAERIYAQGELLARKAEGVDGRLDEDEVNERHRKLAEMGLMDSNPAEHDAIVEGSD